MFFYLSFLRPPPLQAPHYGTISITPQISNDLRTEHFENSQDLYFSWSLQTDQSLNTDSTPTKPLKLTTWRPSTAYKEIPVPLPPGVRQGQCWRLIITGSSQSHGRSHPDTIDLSSEEIGKLVPFPVMSMPVIFSTTGTKFVSSKQEKIERMYSVRLSESTGMRGIDSDDGSVALLRFTEQTSFDLDKVSDERIILFKYEGFLMPCKILFRKYGIAVLD